MLLDAEESCNKFFAISQADPVETAGAYILCLWPACNCICSVVFVCHR